MQGLLQHGLLLQCSVVCCKPCQHPPAQPNQPNPKPFSSLQPSCLPCHRKVFPGLTVGLVSEPPSQLKKPPDDSADAASTGGAVPTKAERQGTTNGFSALGKCWCETLINRDIVGGNALDDATADNPVASCYPLTGIIQAVAGGSFPPAPPPVQTSPGMAPAGMPMPGGAPGGGGDVSFPSAMPNPSISACGVHAGMESIIFKLRQGIAFAEGTRYALQADKVGWVSCNGDGACLGRQPCQPPDLCRFKAPLGVLSLHMHTGAGKQLQCTARAPIMHASTKPAAKTK